MIDDFDVISQYGAGAVAVSASRSVTRIVETEFRRIYGD
jgi:hypothetical protein